MLFKLGPNLVLSALSAGVAVAIQIARPFRLPALTSGKNTGNPRVAVGLGGFGNSMSNPTEAYANRVSGAVVQRIENVVRVYRRGKVACAFKGSSDINVLSKTPSDGIGTVDSIVANVAFVASA
jgi:hypothetical protein